MAADNGTAPTGGNEDPPPPPPPPPLPPPDPFTVDDAADNPAVTTELVTAVEPSEKVIQINLNGNVFFVSQKAKESMALSMEAIASQPTVFFRCKNVAKAVCDILGEDFDEYSLPQTEEEIQGFDWDNVIPGDANTYPKEHVPSKEDFQRVWYVSSSFSSPI